MSASSSKAPLADELARELGFTPAELESDRVAVRNARFPCKWCKQSIFCADIIYADGSATRKSFSAAPRRANDVPLIEIFHYVEVIAWGREVGLIVAQLDAGEVRDQIVYKAHHHNHGGGAR